MTVMPCRPPPRRMAEHPDPPRQVKLIREHEELGVEPAQLLKQLAPDQIRAALRHQHLTRFRRKPARAGQAKEVKANRAQRLETVVVVVQSQRRSGARARPLHFGQELLQAARLQPSVVIQEKEELAARRSRRAIIALAVTQILAVLHEDASRPSLDDSFPQLDRKSTRLNSS